MKPRSLLVLFLIVAALGAFVWFFERDLPSTDERAELAKKVLPIEADEVTALTIEGDGSVVRLEKAPSPAAVESADGDGEEPTSESGWRIVAPIEARADAQEIESVLGTLSRLTKERTLEEFQPEELGLSSPGLVVRLTTADEEWALEVGEEIPATSNVITAVEGKSEAYVVSGDFREGLLKDAGAWRSKKVVPFDRGAVTGLILRGGAEELVLRREGEAFRVEAPLADEADDDKVSDLLDLLTGLEVETFLDDPSSLTELGLEPASKAVTLEREGREDFEIRLGGSDDASEDLLYGFAEGQAFSIEGESGEELIGFTTSPASEWRSRSWTTFDTYQIDRLRLREGDGELELERSDGDWLRGSDKIAYTTASDVLYAIGDVEAERIASFEVADLEAPLLEIVLSSKDREETLRLYGEAGGFYPGVRAGREVVLELSRESVDELRAKIDEARNAGPVPPPAAEGDGGD